jgi:hypothetical protein
MEPTLYVYGPDLEVSGAGDTSFDGTYSPGIGNPELPGAQWVKGAGDDRRFLVKDGNTWFNGGNNGYASAINSEWPWETTYVTDGAEGPSPTVKRKLLTIQEALDALQFKVNIP